jgi:hypothetical protein
MGVVAAPCFQELEGERLHLSFKFIPNDKRHAVVTLVGTTAKPESREQYAKVARKLCLFGYVVISVNLFRSDVPDIEKYRDLLESIHFQKIDMADMVVLIHKDTIGPHTKIELDYARQVGKRILVFTESPLLGGDWFLLPFDDVFDDVSKP